ncbi:GNAT family N-acetyltransferase, partial [Mycobacterium canetti]|uniref:GNAT family N-acetyltransferase n=1 Tax=Mycobacterium canetti TaxID=78331 RepID=UPI0005B3FB97
QTPTTPSIMKSRFRRRGLARGLLSTLAREYVDNRYTRLAWSVLNWNSDAIALYDRIGGQPQHEWTIYRLSGPRLAALAAPR